MNVKRLGIEWGAAYTEAQPLRIKHGSAEVEIFLSDQSELIVQIPAGSWIEPAKVFDGSHGIEVKIRTDD